MEILRPQHSSTIMPPSYHHHHHHFHQQLSDEESLLIPPSSPLPAVSDSPIASPPSALMNVSLPSTDCSCSDFWFGSEDCMQTKIIHSRYMNTFDLSTTRKHASRAPIAFIGLIIRRQITKQIYYKIMQSSDAILPKLHQNNGNNNKINQKNSLWHDDDRSMCCTSNESSTHCDSCRLYTIDEIIINQRDCVPLGFTMKTIQSSIVVTIWDNYDGLPLHQHRLRRWPQGIIEKDSLKPHSYIECNPLYDDDPTGLHCTDASFVYSTHICKHKNNTLLHGPGEGGEQTSICLGYASMNQSSILDALRRFGRPSDAEGVRQLNATGQEGAETDGTENHKNTHTATHHTIEREKHRNNEHEENKNNQSTEHEEDDDDESDHDDNDEDDDDNYQSASDDEDNEDCVDAVDDVHFSLPSSTQPNSLRRHHTEGSSIPRGESRRSKSLRSKSDDEADEAAKLMAKLGLGSFRVNDQKNKYDHTHQQQKMMKNTRNKFSGSTDAEEEDEDGDSNDIDHDYVSDDDHFSSASDHLNACDHGWK